VLDEASRDRLTNLINLLRTIDTSHLLLDHLPKSSNQSSKVELALSSISNHNSPTRGIPSIHRERAVTITKTHLHLRQYRMPHLIRRYLLPSERLDKTAMLTLQLPYLDKLCERLLEAPSNPQSTFSIQRTKTSNLLPPQLFQPLHPRSRLEPTAQTLFNRSPRMFRLPFLQTLLSLRSALDSIRNSPPPSHLFTAKLLRLTSNHSHSCTQIYRKRFLLSRMKWRG